MNPEDIIRMAIQAGFTVIRDENVLIEMLERFAFLVASAEREECAKIVEEGTALIAFQSKDCYRYAYNRCNAIRERTK